MHLDPKALEAAHRAYEKHDQGGDLKARRLSDGHLSAVLRAYLSASLPADAAELVERLRRQVEIAMKYAADEKPDHEKNIPSVFELQVGHLRDIGAEMASLIQSQAAERAADKARIAELEASVDRHTRFISSEYDDVPNVVSVTLSFDNGEEIDSWPFGDFRTARALLNRRAEG